MAKLRRDLILDEGYLKIYCDTQQHLYLKDDGKQKTLSRMPCGCTKYGIAKRRAKKRG